MIALVLVAVALAAWLLRRWVHRRAVDEEQRRLTGSFNRAKSQGR